MRNLPLIESTNVVFARRPLKRAEIEMLKLRRGQVVECGVSNDAIRDAMREELKKIQADDVTDEELQRFKTRQKADLLRSLNNRRI